MHTGRNSSSNLALSTQSCSLKLGKNFSPAHKFPNFVSGHTGSFGCTTSRKADNPKCVTLTSIHFAPCQVRFNINQTQYIIKAKLKVSSKLGKKPNLYEIKSNSNTFEDWGGSSSEFLSTASPLNQSPVISPSTPSTSSLLLLPSPSGLTWLPASSLCKCCSLMHRSYTFSWQEGFATNGIAPFQIGVYSIETFPHCSASPAAAPESVWTFIPYPNPNKHTQSTNCYTGHSQPSTVVSSGQLLTLQKSQTQNSGCLINTGERTAQTHPKGFLFSF